MAHDATFPILATHFNSAETNFPVECDLSLIPSGSWWSTVKADGTDIRAYASDGTTELACEIVTIDTGLETGKVWVKVDSISDSVDTNIILRVDGTSAAVAVGDTYGRNAAWSDYAVVMHLETDFTDSSGNNTLTSNNITVSGGSVALTGDNTEYADIATVAGFDVANNYTVQFDANLDAITSSPNQSRWIDAGNAWYFARDNNNQGVRHNNSTSVTGSGTGMYGGSRKHSAYSFTGAQIDNRFDGVLGGSTGQSNAVGTFTTIRLLKGLSGTLYSFKICNNELDADRVSADHANWASIYNSGAAFFGTVTVSGGASGPAITLSNPAEPVIGSTTATLECDTDTTSGEVWVVVTDSATEPTEAQIKAGQDHTGSAAIFADSDATPTSTTSFSATGLTPDATHYAYFYQENGADTSNVLPSGSWQTQPVTNTITKDEFTWTYIDTGQATGTFATGDPWIVGPVTITDITPASTDVGGTVKNGTQLNFGPSFGEQGWDSQTRSVTFNAGLNVSPNYVGSDLVVTEGSVVSSKTYASQQAVGESQVEAMGILTVLTAPPPANSFRPPCFGTSKSSPAVVGDLDYSFLATETPPASTPALATTEANFAKPWVEQIENFTWQYVPPRTHMPNYGREIANEVGDALCQLNLNYSNVQKETLMIALVQYGIEIAGARENGMEWPANGGMDHGRKGALILAAKALNNATWLGYADKELNFVFAEDQQTFIVTQSDVDQARYTIDGRPRTPYEVEMIGTPEWGEIHFDRPEYDGANWDAFYRQINYSSLISTAAAVRLMGLMDEWNWAPFFEYHERAYQYALDNGIAPDGGTNSISQFQTDMWELSVTDPVLSNPNVTSNAVDTATISCDTTDTAGRVFALVNTSGTTPTEEDVMMLAGVWNDFDDSPTATTSFNVTGLSAATDYYAWFYQVSVNGGSTVLGSGAFQTNTAGDDLLADDVESASEVSVPAIGQSHALEPDDVQSTSEVSAPAVGQTHALAANDVESASEVSVPTLTAGTNNALEADDVESASQVSAPALGQIHVLAANDVESRSEVSTPAIVSGITPDNIEGVLISECRFRTSGDSNVTMDGGVKVAGRNAIMVTVNGVTSTLEWNEGEGRYTGPATEIATYLSGQVGMPVPITVNY